jgi:hypothetical protein
MSHYRHGSRRLRLQGRQLNQVGNRGYKFDVQPDHVTGTAGRYPKSSIKDWQRLLHPNVIIEQEPEPSVAVPEGTPVTFQNSFGSCCVPDIIRLHLSYAHCRIGTKGIEKRATAWRPNRRGRGGGRHDPPARTPVLTHTHGRVNLRRH